MKKEKELKLKKEICNWCNKEIGTNENNCLKCQGYLLATEKFKEKIQNTQMGLKEEFKRRIDNNTNCRDIDEGTLFDREVDEIINKIFTEEFGEKLK